MERSEHLAWCKKRAIEYVKAGDNTQALASFLSDMRKHEETENHPFLDKAMPFLMAGQLSTAKQMEDWINGFN